MLHRGGAVFIVSGEGARAFHAARLAGVDGAAGGGDGGPSPAAESQSGSDYFICMSARGALNRNLAHLQLNVSQYVRVAGRALGRARETHETRETGDALAEPTGDGPVGKDASRSQERVRADLLQCSTSTGRIAAQNPNLLTLDHPVTFRAARRASVAEDLRAGVNVLGQQARCTRTGGGLDGCETRFVAGSSSPEDECFY